MATLPRLRPETFYDIVVEVAIIRPGPIVGQMVHPYLKRRQGQEPVSYPHPSLEPILARTLGVPLFQEQLLRMAMVAAGFSGGEAEELRRAFGFKRSEKRMQQIEGKLRAGMARQGITGDAAEEIIRSITSFALYGFPESHAASFALLVYASAYLKAHYPAAFYTAHAEQPADGVLSPVDAGEGCAATRRPLRADRRAGVGLVLPRRARRPGAAGADVRQRPARRKPAKAIAAPWSRWIADDRIDGVERECRRSRALPEVRLRRSSRCSKHCTRRKGSATSARICGRCPCDASSSTTLAILGPRLSRSALRHRSTISIRRTRPPPRRSRDAGGDRRAQCLRLRSANGAVASRTSHPTRRRIVRRSRPRSEDRRTEGRRIQRSMDRGTRVARTADQPLSPMTSLSALARRLCRHEPDDRAASHVAAAARAGAARRAARQRSAGWTARPARARGRRRHHAAAAGHGKGLRLPHARRRNRHCQHHRPSRSLHRPARRHRRGALPAGGGHASDPGGGDLGQGGTADCAGRGVPASGFTRFSMTPPRRAEDVGDSHIIPRMSLLAYALHS